LPACKSGRRKPSRLPGPEAKPLSRLIIWNFLCWPGRLEATRGVVVQAEGTTVKQVSALMQKIDALTLRERVILLVLIAGRRLAAGRYRIARAAGSRAQG
jgi:hypothetical protein